MKRPHVVQQGETLLQLAARHGFEANKVWNDPDHDTLRTKLKRDPNVLHPGDVLYLPEPKRTWFPITVGEANSFTATPLGVFIRVAFDGDDGKPLAGEPYVVEGARVPPGKLDDDGCFQARIPPSVRKVVLRFPTRAQQHVLEVGHLDPVDTESGLRQRLSSLGYLADERREEDFDDDDDAEELEQRALDLRIALMGFQKSNALDATGEADDTTRQKLVGVFGR